MRDILVKVINESYESQLRQVSTPVRLVWGGDDTEVPVSVAEAAQPFIADGSLEVLPGVGHFVPLQAPGSLRAAVEEVSG
jgi:pimeloyl-ACP methyl ester carboxylesterase